mmetsp:Transcript_29801/g.54089  ORF Transcript_29801/g.54089 Transcript_29801/m.54089 type:complete len:402 (-) Transcript_29801:175-1380(-)
MTPSPCRWEQEHEKNQQRRFGDAGANTHVDDAAIRSNSMATECRNRLIESIRRIEEGSSATSSPRKLGLLLSGGVDSCAILQAAKFINARIEAAVTVTIADRDSRPPQDELYACEAARLYNEGTTSANMKMKHSVVRLSPAELIQEYSRPTIQALQLWGYMDTRNSLIISAALQECNQLGVTDVIIGDNADELFGGSYDCYFDDKYINDADGWKKKRDSMADLPFVTKKLAAVYGVTAHQPFTDPTFVEWALRETTRSDCVTTKCSVQSEFGGPWEVQNCGKLPLRDAFCTLASWRQMDWIFRGSGADAGDILVNHYNTSMGISDDEFQSEQDDYRIKGVLLKSKEHLHNIRIFQSINGGLHHPTKQRFPIGDCRGCISCCFEIDEMFCHLCDAYPAQHPK